MLDYLLSERSWTEENTPCWTLHQTQLTNSITPSFIPSSFLPERILNKQSRNVELECQSKNILISIVNVIYYQCYLNAHNRMHCLSSQCYIIFQKSTFIVKEIAWTVPKTWKIMDACLYGNPEPNKHYCRKSMVYKTYGLDW